MLKSHHDLTVALLAYGDYAWNLSLAKEVLESRFIDEKRVIQEANGFPRTYSEVTADIGHL